LLPRHTDVSRARCRGALGDLAITLARARGEAHAELRARNYQGLIALRHGDVADAERHFAAALDMARALGDHTTEARCLNNLGFSRISAAIPKRRSPVTGLRSSHISMRATCVHGGDLPQHRHQPARSGNPRAALGAAEEAVRLATQASDEQLVALAATGRAELHVALGDAAFAAAELKRAAERYTRIGFRAGLPEVWRVQAAVAAPAATPPLPFPC